MVMKKNLLFTLALSVGLGMNGFAQSEKTVDNPFTHDPVLAKQGDTYYLFATGQGVSVMSSKDLKRWKFEKPVFAEAPQWAVEAIDGYRGHTWAPDIIYHDGLYHLFYSCSAFAKNTSAIGHATNPTLDPASPDFKWTDHGKIIQSVPNRDMWNAIDPNIIVDEDGTPWMNFGSFWDGIQLVKLDNTMHIAKGEKPFTIARRYPVGHKPAEENPTSKYAGPNAIEAPFILKRGDWYYLFVSQDYCCRGMESTYRVAVGRSRQVAGPYLDREGKDMAQGGGTVLLEGDKKEYEATGHSAAYDFPDGYLFICHGYSVAQKGASVLVQRGISWDEQGWPVLAD